MDGIDPELRDKIIETHTDMKHVRRTLQEHDDGIEELRNQHDDKIEELRNLHDERLREIEQTQSKIMTYIVIIGSAITFVMNAVIQGGMYVLEKIWK